MSTTAITPENALLHRGKLTKSKSKPKSKSAKPKPQHSDSMFAQELQDEELARQVAQEEKARAQSPPKPPPRIDVPGEEEGGTMDRLKEQVKSKLPAGSPKSDEDVARDLEKRLIVDDGEVDGRRRSSESRTSIGDRVKGALGLESHSHSTSNGSEALSPAMSTSSSTSLEPSSSTASGSNEGGKKKTRKEARKEKKAGTLQRIKDQIKAEIGSGGPDEREIERKKLDRACADLGVQVVEINPDGHCMYSAIADQLRYLRLADLENHQTLRKTAAAQLHSNPSKYLPFLPARDGSDDMMSPQAFGAYCDEVANTSLWGGQVELMALSEVYKRPIHVIEADSPAPLKFGEEFQVGSQEPMRVSYHRKMYGLGEHYNSLRKRKH